jgi:hypothetical protein
MVVCKMCVQVDLGERKRFRWEDFFLGANYSVVGYMKEFTAGGIAYIANLKPFFYDDNNPTITIEIIYLYTRMTTTK